MRLKERCATFRWLQKTQRKVWRRRAVRFANGLIGAPFFESARIVIE
jgi:hypothetical protein